MKRFLQHHWRHVAVLAIFVVAALSFAGFGLDTSSAQDDDDIDTDKPVSEMNTEEFLEWLQGAGVNTVIGVGWSYLTFLIPFFGRMSPKGKRMAVLTACLLIPIGAQAILWHLNGMPEKTGELMTELWDVTKAGLTAFSTSQIVHTRKL